MESRDQNRDYVRPRSKCHGLILLETDKSNSMFADRTQNFIKRLDFGGGKGCHCVFFPWLLFFPELQETSPVWALGIVSLDMYFVVTFFYLGTFFLFYCRHYFVTSFTLPFLRKHLGTHSNEQMKQTNKRQKNNEYHNWSRKFSPPKLRFKSRFSHHSARGEYFLPVVFSYPVSREIRSVPWALNLKQVQWHERTTTDWLQK